MLDMAPPKKKPGRPQKHGRKGKALNVWISEALRDALDGLIEESRPRGTVTEHVEIALEKYLAEHGRWPPPEND
jgi:hypothetical protein